MSKHIKPDNRFIINSAFMKDGKELVNRFTLVDKGHYVQVWIDNKNAGYAGCRIELKELPAMIEWLYSLSGIKSYASELSGIQRNI